MANCIVEVEAPRDIARQLLRHRSFSFQEFSQRYADVRTLGDFYVLREARMQDTKNRQNSIHIEDEETKQWWLEQQQALLKQVDALYSEALNRGLAKEVARVVLPEGLTNSRLYVNGTIRSWCHYLDVRTEQGVTQQEHVELARMIAEAITEAFDVSQFVR